MAKIYYIFVIVILQNKSRVLKDKYKNFVFQILDKNTSKFVVLCKKLALQLLSKSLDSVNHKHFRVCFTTQQAKSYAVQQRIYSCNC